MAYKRSIKWDKTIKGFSQALGYAGEHLSGWAREWMTESVNNSLTAIDSEWDRHAEAKSGSGKRMSFGGSHFYPWYSGNLHDSVAGIVSDKHRLVSIAYMPEAADGIQTYGGMQIIGHDWAIKGAQDMQRVLHLVPGIKASISVGVPYAGKVDESDRHDGFIRELSVQFAANVEDYFIMKAGEYRTRVFIADKKK